MTYRYVTGVNNFSDFIRFDSNATLTDTNEVEYGINQHLYLKEGDDQPVDFLSWKLVQKHYFDSTFGGALVPGQRNVFEALDSITPFAFALYASKLVSHCERRKADARADATMRSPSSSTIRN